MQESYEDVFDKVLCYQSHPYCIFRIKDDTTVTLEKLGEPRFVYIYIYIYIYIIWLVENIGFFRAISLSQDNA